uniref:Uncharacterized protein n=1 Tax=Steinernema glaseri TaxID=37863 RepID=A0A1I7YKR1_9BILA
MVEQRSLLVMQLAEFPEPPGTKARLDSRGLPGPTAKTKAKTRAAPPDQPPRNPRVREGPEAVITTPIMSRRPGPCCFPREQTEPLNGVKRNLESVCVSMRSKMSTSLSEEDALDSSLGFIIRYGFHGDDVKVAKNDSPSDNRINRRPETPLIERQRSPKEEVLRANEGKVLEFQRKRSKAKVLRSESLNSSFPKTYRFLWLDFCPPSIQFFGPQATIEQSVRNNGTCYLSLLQLQSKGPLAKALILCNAQTGMLRRSSRCRERRRDFAFWICKSGGRANPERESRRMRRVPLGERVEDRPKSRPQSASKGPPAAGEPHRPNPGATDDDRGDRNRFGFFLTFHARVTPTSEFAAALFVLRRDNQLTRAGMPWGSTSGRQEATAAAASVPQSAPCARDPAAAFGRHFGD